MLNFLLGFLVGYWSASNKETVDSYCEKVVQWVKSKIESFKKTDETN